jgi:hypothetical protein
MREHCIWKKEGKTEGRKLGKLRKEERNDRE